jgi:hypothetical protein
MGERWSRVAAVGGWCAGGGIVLVCHFVEDVELKTRLKTGVSQTRLCKLSPSVVAELKLECYEEGWNRRLERRVAQR